MASASDGPAGLQSCGSSAESELFQEREQLVVRSEATRTGGRRGDAGQSLFLQPHVGVKVYLRRGRKRFGDQGYAMEELVELGSAFLSSDLDLTPELRSDHASYIASWIKILKDDKRAIFTAASHAPRAADFLHGLQKSASAQADAA
jgi:hypothetical protein